MESYDILIIGGGSAGLAAAAAAYDKGIRRILILERDKEAGGILNQCIHNGFGLHTFQEEMTGPEYAGRFLDEVKKREIAMKTDTMVLEISDQKEVLYVNKTEGIRRVRAEAIVLAMGCRERSRGALNIPGFRPAGIYTAGTAQRLVNIEGYMPGKEIVILGSGDIGLIMARRMTLEGAKVRLVAELMPYSGGLKRNIVQCLEDFEIPLKLSHTVVDIIGKERVEAVIIAEVDEKNRPIPGTEETYPCDTLLLSCGLIPENELSRQMGIRIDPVTSGPFVNERMETSIPGVFAAGNVLHVHDLVDFVTEEAAAAGKHAAEYVLARTEENEKTDLPGKKEDGQDMGLRVAFSNGPRYVVPAYLKDTVVKDPIIFRFRVGRVIKNHYLSLYVNGQRISHKKRMVMVPSEMETVLLSKKDADRIGRIDSIEIRVEEE